MNERKLLLGWKRITEYTGISRLLMIRYAYPCLLYTSDAADE